MAYGKIIKLSSGMSNALLNRKDLVPVTDEDRKAVWFLLANQYPVVPVECGENYICPSCDEILDEDDSYCRWCGRSLDWDALHNESAVYDGGGYFIMPEKCFNE